MEQEQSELERRIDCPQFAECTQAMFDMNSAIAEACGRECPVKEFMNAVWAYNKTVERGEHDAV